jgi:hypothetical protein
MALFDALGVGHFVHCGDVCGTGVLEEMIGRNLTFVWGNMDEPDPGTDAYIRTLGLTPPGLPPERFEIDGQRFAVFHGHERGFARSVETLDVDYLLHGHTHVRRDERIGDRRIINPGALHRATVKTVATLNPVTDELRFHEIDDGR